MLDILASLSAVAIPLSALEHFVATAYLLVSDLTRFIEVLALCPSVVFVVCATNNSSIFFIVCLCSVYLAIFIRSMFVYMPPHGYFIIVTLEVGVFRVVRIEDTLFLRSAVIPIRVA